MSDMWIGRFEEIGEALEMGEMDRAEAHAALKGLGLDQEEIVDHLDTINVEHLEGDEK